MFWGFFVLFFCGKLLESFGHVGMRTVTEHADRHEGVNLLQ